MAVERQKPEKQVSKVKVIGILFMAIMLFSTLMLVYVIDPADPDIAVDEFIKVKNGMISYRDYNGYNFQFKITINDIVIEETAKIVEDKRIVIISNNSFGITEFIFSKLSNNEVKFTIDHSGNVERDYQVKIVVDNNKDDYELITSKKAVTWKSGHFDYSDMFFLATDIIELDNEISIVSDFKMAYGFYIDPILSSNLVFDNEVIFEYENSLKALENVTSDVYYMDNTTGWSNAGGRLINPSVFAEGFDDGLLDGWEWYDADEDADTGESYSGISLTSNSSYVYSGSYSLNLSCNDDIGDGADDVSPVANYTFSQPIPVDRVSSFNWWWWKEISSQTIYYKVTYTDDTGSWIERPNSYPAKTWRLETPALTAGKSIKRLEIRNYLAHKTHSYRFFVDAIQFSFDSYEPYSIDAISNGDFQLLTEEQQVNSSYASWVGSAGAKGSDFDPYYTQTITAPVLRLNNSGDWAYQNLTYNTDNFQEVNDSTNWIHYEPVISFAAQNVGFDGTDEGLNVTFLYDDGSEGYQYFNGSELQRQFKGRTFFLNASGGGELRELETLSETAAKYNSTNAIRNSVNTVTGMVGSQAYWSESGFDGDNYGYITVSNLGYHNRFGWYCANAGGGWIEQTLYQDINFTWFEFYSAYVDIGGTEEHNQNLTVRFTFDDATTYDHIYTHNSTLHPILGSDRYNLDNSWKYQYNSLALSDLPVEYQSKAVDKIRITTKYAYMISHPQLVANYTGKTHNRTWNNYELNNFTSGKILKQVKFINLGDTPVYIDDVFLGDYITDYDNNTFYWADEDYLADLMNASLLDNGYGIRKGIKKYDTDLNSSDSFNGWQIDINLDFYAYSNGSDSSFSGGVEVHFLNEIKDSIAYVTLMDNDTTAGNHEIRGALFYNTSISSRVNASLIEVDSVNYNLSGQLKIRMIAQDIHVYFPDSLSFGGSWVNMGANSTIFQLGEPVYLALVLERKNNTRSIEVFNENDLSTWDRQNYPFRYENISITHYDEYFVDGSNNETIEYITGFTRNGSNQVQYNVNYTLGANDPVISYGYYHNFSLPAEYSFVNVTFPNGSLRTLENGFEVIDLGDNGKIINVTLDQAGEWIWFFISSNAVTYLEISPSYLDGEQTNVSSIDFYVRLTNGSDALINYPVLVVLKYSDETVVDSDGGLTGSGGWYNDSITGNFVMSDDKKIYVCVTSTSIELVGYNVSYFTSYQDFEPPLINEVIYEESLEPKVNFELDVLVSDDYTEMANISVLVEYGFITSVDFPYQGYAALENNIFSITISGRADGTTMWFKITVEDNMTNSYSTNTYSTDWLVIPDPDTGDGSGSGSGPGSGTGTGGGAGDFNTLLILVFMIGAVFAAVIVIGLFRRISIRTRRVEEREVITVLGKVGRTKEKIVEKS